MDGLLIGRFQPFHNAHLEIVKRATALCDKLIIVVGSSRQPRTYKNPFTFEERSQMIRHATMGLSMQISVEANIDTIYNDQAWAVRVQQIVAKHTWITMVPKTICELALLATKKTTAVFT